MNDSMKPEMTWGQIFDRLTILIRKHRLDSVNYRKELNVYLLKVSTILNIKHEILFMLLNLSDINMQIWSMETDIRQRKDIDLGLNEIGRRAIEIREMNAIRIKTINDVTEALDDPKQLHLEIKL